MAAKAPIFRISALPGFSKKYSEKITEKSGLLQHGRHVEYYNGRKPQNIATVPTKPLFLSGLSNTPLSDYRTPSRGGVRQTNLEAAVKRHKPQQWQCPSHHWNRLDGPNPTVKPLLGSRAHKISPIQIAMSSEYDRGYRAENRANRHA